MIEIDSQFTHLACEAFPRNRGDFPSSNYFGNAQLFSEDSGVTALNIEFDIIIVADRPYLSHLFV